MRDANLILLNNVDCAAGSLIATGVPTAPYVLVSTSIPTRPPISGHSQLSPGPGDSVGLEITCSQTFVDPGACIVSLELVSTTTDDPVAIATAMLATGDYLSHWKSQPIGSAAFKANKRIATTLLPQDRLYLPYLTLFGIFTDSGLTSGRLSAKLAYLTNMVHTPPPDAVTHR